MLLTQGRSKDGRPITVTMSMQRPSRISRFVLSQALHVISFILEGRDSKTLAEATVPEIQYLLPQLSLQEHEFLWFHRLTRRIWKGKYNIETKNFEGNYLEKPYFLGYDSMGRIRRGQQRMYDNDVEIWPKDYREKLA